MGPDPINMTVLMSVLRGMVFDQVPFSVSGGVGWSES